MPTGSGAAAARRWRPLAVFVQVGHCLATTPLLSLNLLSTRVLIKRTAPLSPILFSPIHLGASPSSYFQARISQLSPAFVPLLLVLARVAYVQGKRILGSNKRKDKHMSIVVKWGRERYVANTWSPSRSDVPLSILRRHAATASLS